MIKKTATAFAPATTGNVGVGFDILGMALKTIGDTVTVTRTRDTGTIKILGSPKDGIPTNPEKNTATAGLVQLLKDQNLNLGFSVKIKKGIPLGSGMGGSAASAVAGIVAANALLDQPLSQQELLKYALIGEAVASGSAHGDNVAPCLFGGLVLVQQDVVAIPFPRNLVIVIGLPSIRVNTRDARKILRPTITLKDHVRQSGHLAGFIIGCFKNDHELIRRSFKDIIIEPQRAGLITGFHEVKAAALQGGALGCTISGAGPAVFAIATPKTAAQIKTAMMNAFKTAGVKKARGWISPVNHQGAHLV